MRVRIDLRSVSFWKRLRAAWFIVRTGGFEIDKADVEPARG